MAQMICRLDVRPTLMRIWQTFTTWQLRDVSLESTGGEIQSQDWPANRVLSPTAWRLTAMLYCRQQRAQMAQTLLLATIA